MPTPAHPSPTSTAPAGRLAAGTWQGAAAIALAALAAYWPSLAGGFVFDDHFLVEQSSLLRGPLWRIWFTTDAVDYWPLTSTTFWLELRLWGADPAAFRLLNLALHVGAAVLLWRLLVRLEVPGAWLAGLLFALHPVGVESAAWISERKNVLSAVFFLGAALAWLSFCEEGRTRSAAAAAGLFACALLAKTSTVALPVALLGASLARGRRPSARQWRWLALLFGLALAAGAATLWFQWTRSMGGVALGRSVAERVAAAGQNWAVYLWTALQPFAASVVYARWPAAPSSPLAWAPHLALLAAAALLWSLRRRLGDGPLLALALHGLLLFPVLGLLDMAFFLTSPVGNHLQYLALMAPVALVASGLGHLAAGPWRRAAWAAAGALALVLAAETAWRSAAWRDDLSLWERAVAEAPQSLTAARMHAGALADAGRPREALAALEAASRRLRDPGDAGRARSLLLAQLDREAEAAAEEQAASALRPDLGFRYELGVILSRGGKASLAVPLLEDLVRRQPGSPQNRYQLASALSKVGRLEEAARELTVGCRLSPRHSDACQALAMVLVRLGRGGEARAALADAMGLARQDPAVTRALAATGGRAP